MQTPVQKFRPSSLFNGWPLLGVTSALLLALAIAILAAMPGIDGLRMLVRATARTSLLFFLPAFASAALWALWPAAPTRWLRANRRYLGLSFAVSHGIHALALITLLNLDPVLFMQLTNQVTIATGLLAYAFIVAMSATSFDRSARWIGPRAWRWLHTAGTYYLWISFVVAFGKRYAQGPVYGIAVAVLLSALVLRLVVKLRTARTAARPLA
jgi:DMSO/TMAO reductase YedYZ heme-binding membrane subunit